MIKLTTINYMDKTYQTKNTTIHSYINRPMDKQTTKQMYRKTNRHMDKKQTDRYIIDKQQGLTLCSKQ